MPLPIIVAGAVAAGWAIANFFSDDTIDDQQPRHEEDIRIGLLSVFLQVAEIDGGLNEKEKSEILTAVRAIYDNESNTQAEELLQIAKQNLLVNEALELAKNKPPIGNFMLLSCLKIAACDGTVNDGELSIISELARKTEQVDSLGDYFAFYVRKSFSFPADSKKDNALKCLGLEHSADDSEIKKQYLKLSKDFHPDRLEALKLPQHLVDLSTERFKEISDAYKILCEKPILVYCFNNDETQEAAHGSIASCLFCDCKLRLPEKEKILKARCPKCYSFLAFPESL